MDGQHDLGLSDAHVQVTFQSGPDGRTVCASTLGFTGWVGVLNFHRWRRFS